MDSLTAFGSGNGFAGHSLVVPWALADLRTRLRCCPEESDVKGDQREFLSCLGTLGRARPRIAPHFLLPRNDLCWLKMRMGLFWSEALNVETRALSFFVLRASQHRCAETHMQTQRDRDDINQPVNAFAGRHACGFGHF